MIVPRAVFDSLNSLLNVLEYELRGAPNDTRVDPELYSTCLLAAASQISKWPKETKKLLQKWRELDQQFAVGSEFDLLRVRLHKELLEVTLDCRPEALSKAEATNTLEGWRNATNLQDNDLFLEDPAFTARELHRDFTGWRLPQSTSECVHEMQAILTRASREAALSPFRGVHAFQLLVMKPHLTLLDIEELFKGEDAPTTRELLQAVRWLISAESAPLQRIPGSREKAIGPWHSADEAPPDEFQYGPLTGQRKQLALWIMQQDDPRNLDEKLKNGVYWGRRDKRTQFSVWFKVQKRFAQANTIRRAEE